MMDTKNAATSIHGDENCNKRPSITNIDTLPPPILPPQRFSSHQQNPKTSAINNEIQSYHQNQKQTKDHLLQNQNHHDQDRYHHHNRSMNRQPPPPPQQQQQQKPSIIKDDDNGGRGQIVTDRRDNNNNNNDPHDIYNRFVENQLMMYDRAISEIRQGQKRSCWFWFVLPCAPYVVDGIERGSSMNRHFALRGDNAVIAFLNYQNRKINLRTNYIQILEAIIQQLQYGNTLLNIFGPLDDVKAISSFQLFHHIATKMNDEELKDVTYRVLDLSIKQKKKKKKKFVGRPMLRGIL